MDGETGGRRPHWVQYLDHQTSVSSIHRYKAIKPYFYTFPHCHFLDTVCKNASFMSPWAGLNNLASPAPESRESPFMTEGYTTASTVPFTSRGESLTHVGLI